MSSVESIPIGSSRTMAVDLAELPPGRADMVRALDERLERFCSLAPLSELNVILHSTGVNYAHQFWILSMLGRGRLSQFKSVHFVSGAVIAAVVYYSYKTGNLQYGRGSAHRWEQDFFTAHRLSPARSSLRIPYQLLSGRPMLSHQVQMDVIRAGIGKGFGDETVSFFPGNFHFWLYDETSQELVCATADNDLNFLKLVELAVAATAVPRIFVPLKIGSFRFVDPVFSSARGRLAARLREISGPTLVSNMVVDRDTRSRSFVRPHRHARGRLLMVRELMQFCLGVSNRDHVEGLECGLVVMGDLMD